MSTILSEGASTLTLLDLFTLPVKLLYYYTLAALSWRLEVLDRIVADLRCLYFGLVSSGPQRHSWTGDHGCLAFFCVGVLLEETSDNQI